MQWRQRLKKKIRNTLTGIVNFAADGVSLQLVQSVDSTSMPACMHNIGVGIGFLLVLGGHLKFKSICVCPCTHPESDKDLLGIKVWKAALNSCMETGILTLLAT